MNDLFLLQREKQPMSYPNCKNHNAVTCKRHGLRHNTEPYLEVARYFPSGENCKSLTSA
jgi:hypothetical protein